MTKVIPTPRTAQTAMFWEISEKLTGGEELAAGRDREERHDHDKDAEDPHRLKLAIRLSSDVALLLCRRRRRPLGE